MKEENNINEYQNPELMIEEIEEIFNMDFLELKDRIMCSKIELTKENIKNIFDEILQGKYSDVLIRNSMRKKLKNKINYINKDASYSERDFFDSKIINKYTLDFATYDYYQKCVDILIKKSMLLLTIIEKICNQDTSDIIELLGELDIEINENGSIKYVDRYRLVTPTIYVIKELFKKLEKANDINTYMNEKISSNLGTVEFEEMMPTTLNLQIKNIDYVNTNGEDGYVPLSYDQREQLKEEDCNNIKKLVKMLGNGFEV